MDTKRLNEKRVKHMIFVPKKRARQTMKRIQEERKEELNKRLMKLREEDISK
jgi:hypothetical protein